MWDEATASRAEDLLAKILSEGRNWRHIEGAYELHSSGRFIHIQLKGLGKRTMFSGQKYELLNVTFQWKGKEPGGPVVASYDYPSDCIASWTLDKIKGQLTEVPVTIAPLDRLADDVIVKDILNGAAGYFDVMAKGRFQQWSETPQGLDALLNRT